jgi:hypothetical protein
VVGAMEDSGKPMWGLRFPVRVSWRRGAIVCDETAN